MQDTVLGKTCASLYHLKYSVWLIKLIWSVRGNQEPCPATCCSPAGVTVTDAGQAGFLTLWLQVFTVFPSRAATPPECPGSPKFLNRPRESLCTSFYLDLPTVSGINQEYLSSSHRPALRRGLKDGNSYEKLNITITLDYIQLQILSQMLQSPQTLKITVCMSHACKLTSSAQKEAVSSACDHRCPRGYPSLGQSCVQFFSLVWSLSCVYQLRDMTHLRICARGTFSVLGGKFICLSTSLSFSRYTKLCLQSFSMCVHCKPFFLSSKMEICV